MIYGVTVKHDHKAFGMAPHVRDNLIIFCVWFAACVFGALLIWVNS